VSGPIYSTPVVAQMPGETAHQMATRSLVQFPNLGASASRCAPTSRPKASTGLPVGVPGRNVNIGLSEPHSRRSKAEGAALLSVVMQGSLQAAIFLRRLDATVREGSGVGARCSRSRRLNPGERATARSATPGNLVSIQELR
jgi:hypothetical protein